MAEDHSIEQIPTTYLVACSGACSNLGQLSARVLLGLAREGFGQPFCLAGLAAHSPGFLKRGRQGRFIVIDGCPQQCALKTVEHVGFNAARGVVIAQLGVEKSGDLEIPQEELVRVLARAKEELAKRGRD